MAENVRVFALGGLDEDGKNCYVIEAGQDIFVLEAGSKYPDVSKPGIDLVIPNFSYLKENKHRVRAYIITHGHDDLFGALPFIYEDVPAPIYASKPTIVMIEAFSKKWGFDHKYNFVETKPTAQHIIAGRQVNFFQTTHMMMGSFGVALNTEAGYIIYSGDYIVEYSQNESYSHDLNSLAKISEKNVLALLIESKGADRKGYTSPNHRLTPHILRPFQDAKGRIFISVYNQSTYQLEEIIAVARRFNKKIYFYDDEVRRYFRQFQNIGQLRLPPSVVVDKDDLLRVRQSDLLILMMGQGDEVYRQIALLASKSHEDRRISLLPTDTFIVAAPPAYNFETLATQAIDDLYKTGVEVVNIGRRKLISMHASEEDVKMLLSLLRPKYYIPVTGDYTQMMANAKLAVGMGIGLNHNNVFLLENGNIINFVDGKARLHVRDNEVIEAKELYIDGMGVGDTSSGVLEDRSTLSNDGVVVLGLSIDKFKRQIVAGPDIQMRGFIFVRENDVIISELAKMYVEIVDKALKAPGKFDENAVITEVEDAASRILWRETRRRPMILPLLSNI